MRFAAASVLFTLWLSAPMLPESPEGLVTGHVVGLPVGNQSSIHVVLIRYNAPCVFVQAPVRSDGSFQFGALATGNYSVAVTGLPKGYALKTMSSGSLELLSESLRVVPSNSSPAAPIQIEVAPLSDFKRGLGNE